MITSEKTNSLLAAMIEAKNEIDTGVGKDGTNQNFGSTYSTLGAILKAIEKPLAANKLIIIQAPEKYEGGCIVLTTRVFHVSGEFIETESSIPVEFADPQGAGSAITYLRRYALTSLLGLYQADDDGNTATPRRVPVAVAQEKQQAQAAKPAQTSVAKPAASAQPAATSGKVDSWLKTIANASLERLQTAVKTAESTFQGSELETIRAAFAARFEELGVTA